MALHQLVKPVFCERECKEKKKEGARGRELKETVRDIDCLTDGMIHKEETKKETFVFHNLIIQEPSVSSCEKCNSWSSS